MLTATDTQGSLYYIFLFFYRRSVFEIVDDSISGEHILLVKFVTKKHAVALLAIVDATKFFTFLHTRVIIIEYGIISSPPLYLPYIVTLLGDSRFHFFYHIVRAATRRIESIPRRHGLSKVGL